MNTTIDENSFYFSIPFAVADIKYNILGTPFFEDNIQNINKQDFTLEFKYQSKTHPNYTKFTTLLSKDYPYFSYIYRINSKTQIRLKPKSSKIAHFPIKNYLNLHFTTTPQNHFFPSVPHTYFATNFRTNFNFIEVFTDDKPDICATIIQNTSKHVATLPTGHIGYIEVPITNEKPKFFQVNDINTLIHNVTHTYHPDITEPLPQTNYIVQYDDPTTPPPQFSLHQIYMTNDDIPNQTSPLYNVQPTSHTSEKRIFPSLPYTSENLKFNNKFNFQFSDLTDTEYITLCNMLLKYKTCYATHKNDVGKISTPFRIRLKPNAQLMTQRPSKVPIHYRDKLNVLLKELEKYNIIKQIGSSPQDKPVYGTTYLNPLIIIPKGDTIKCVLDARHLNSNTEQSDESWPIEPLAPQLARANKKYKSAIDLMYAYAHTPLEEDTIKLTSFSSGDKLFAFIRGFYGLKGLPNFFTKQMPTFFKTLIEQGFALVYIDDILLLSDSKDHMFQLIEQLHLISTKHNLKLAPEKSFFMLLKVKFLGHEIGYNTVKPIHSKIAAIHKIPSPTGKVALLSFIGALNFYTKFIEKLHINLKPFYDLLHENTRWKWTDEHESLFQKLKMSLTSETELTIPNTKHPFFITIDASLIGLGAVLFQLNEQNKMKVISYNYRILNPQEQKLSTLDRELLGIVHALQIYEFLIIGSPHPIHIFTDHKPLLHCFTKKGNLSPRFYRAQMQLTKFSKLKIIHTPGKNLSVADMPSHLQEQKHRSEYFEVPDLDTKVQRHNNPHYWLQRDIVQIKHFQYRYFNNIILTDDTIEQVKIFTQFLFKFLRFNYQLIWEQKDQQAYVNFPHILTHTELLPYIIQNENKHLHYRDLTSLNVTHLEQINLHSTFILEHSETSDNRPFTTSDTSHETTPEEQTFSVEPLYTRQQSEQSEQEPSEQEAFANIFHNPDSPQEQLLYSPQLQAPDIQQTNPSETNTIHNTSEFSEETVQNTQSLTITDDSNRIIIPTHNITQNDITNQSQDNTSYINQDNTSMISTSNTNITQPSQTQILSPRNYNPPSVPP